MYRLINGVDSAPAHAILRVSRGCDGEIASLEFSTSQSLRSSRHDRRALSRAGIYAGLFGGFEGPAFLVVLKASCFLSHATEPTPT